MSISRLKAHAKEITGVEPLSVEYDESCGRWVMFFNDKIPVYVAYIEYYKCAKNIHIGYSENLKCWYMMND